MREPDWLPYRLRFRPGPRPWALRAPQRQDGAPEAGPRPDRAAGGRGASDATGRRRARLALLAAARAAYHRYVCEALAAAAAASRGVSAPA
jgi:hypothetical protein